VDKINFTVTSAETMQREACERFLKEHFARIEQVPLHPPALQDAYRAGFRRACKYKDDLAACADEMFR